MNHKTNEPGLPCSPEINGVAERTKRTIVNHVGCALLSAQMPKTFWVEALQYIWHSIIPTLCYTPTGFTSANSTLSLPFHDHTQLKPFEIRVWYKVPRRRIKRILMQRLNKQFVSPISHTKKRSFVWDLHGFEVVKSKVESLMGKDFSTNHQELSDLYHKIPLIGHIPHRYKILQFNRDVCLPQYTRVFEMWSDGTRNIRQKCAT